MYSAAVGAREHLHRLGSVRRAREVVERTLSRLQLEPIAGRIAHRQRQWVEIATVLAQESDMILLDKPVAG